MPFDPTKPATIVTPGGEPPVVSTGFDPSKPAAVVSRASTFNPNQPAQLVAGPTYDTELTPEQKRYRELKDEIKDYGLGDLVKPASIEKRGGIFSTKTTPQADLDALAAGIGIDKETARTLGPLLGAVPPLEEMTLAKGLELAAGRLNYALGNLPGFVTKKIATDDPKIRQFVDEARELAEGRMGAVEFVGWNFLPVGKIAKGIARIGETAEAAKKASMAADIVKGTTTGAAYGLGQSREGTEMESALQGAAVGGALAGVISGVATKIRNRAEAAGDVKAKEISADFFKNNEADIDAVTKEAYGKVEKSTNAMADVIVDEKPLTQDEARLIIDEQLKPDTVDLIKEKLADDYRKALPAEQRGAAIPDAVIDELAVANEVIRQQKKQFAQYIVQEIPQFRPAEDITIKQTPDVVIATARSLGPDFLKDKFKAKTAVEVGESQLGRLNVQIGPGKFATGKTLANAVGDRQFGFIVTDERAGTRTYPKFLDFMTNHNLYTAEKHDFQKRSNDLYSAAKDLGLKKEVRSGARGSNFFNAMDKEDFASLPTDQQQLARDIRDYFDTARWRFNTIEGKNLSPLNIPKREGFGLPHMTVDPVETTIRLKDKLGEVEAKLGDLKKLATPEDFFKTSNAIPELDELRRGVNLFTDAPVQDGRQLLQALQSITGSGAASAKLSTTASTVFQRKDVIPDFLREKDIFKLMARYTDNGLRNVYFRNILRDLVKDANFLDKVGAKPEAAFVRRFVSDNLGIREFSMARLGNESRIAFARAAESTLEKVIPDAERRREVVNGLRLAPELAASLQHNIYPNVLGLNARSHLSQLTQVLFKNAPELGGTYGYTTAIKSMMNVLLNWKQLGARLEEVTERGLEPKGFLREASESVANGAEQALLYNTPAKALRTMADATMWSYGKLNTINLAMTRDMASRILDDIAAGNAAAFKSVNKMPTPIRRSLIENKGNRQAQQVILENYLASVTQYQYNRAAMSELGVVAGPFFSTFTKWPLATAGDIAAEIRVKGLQKGLPRVAEKYAAIWALAAAIDVALYKALTGDWEADPNMKDVGDRAAKILGQGGIRSMAPIESVSGLASAAGLGKPTEKGMFTPPVIDALFNNVLRPALDGDTERLAAGGLKTLSTFAPGGFLYRILMQDIPTYVTGEKPGGK